MKTVVLFSAFAFVSLMAFAQRPNEAAPGADVPTQPQIETELAQQPSEPQHIVLRIVGSHVRNPEGDKLGRIEEVLLNRATRAMDYAVLAPNFPTNQSRLVPVPWSILTYAWDQSRENSAGNVPPRGVSPRQTRGTPLTPPGTAPASATR
jgi:hypothetical protein